MSGTIVSHTLWQICISKKDRQKGAIACLLGPQELITSYILLGAPRTSCRAKCYSRLCSPEKVSSLYVLWKVDVGLQVFWKLPSNKIHAGGIIIKPNLPAIPIL